MEFKNTEDFEDICRSEIDSGIKIKQELPEIVDSIVDSSLNNGGFTHIDYEPLPSKEKVVKIIDKFLDLLYPGYFSKEKINPVNIKYYIGKNVTELYELISDQISCSIRHDCIRFNTPCGDCSKKGQIVAVTVLNSVTQLRNTLTKDIKAVYDGDPAAKSYDEIIFSYPGLYAVSVYRIANLLYKAKVPLVPRIMTEHAHSLTGIDIHPGAEIGDRFVIDHGTGVVIGETTIIGNNVRIYQGVTIGALSLPREAIESLKETKRHPTIEDDVIIYAGATILGGDTIIGKGTTVGGNVWLTDSVPSNTRVFMKEPELSFI